MIGGSRGLACAGLIFLTACSASEDELTLVFPTEEARAAASSIAYTAFEPIIVNPEDEVPTFVSCKNIGVFPPTRIVDPDTISTFPNLGEVTRERESQAYPLDGSWDLELKRVGGDDANNPWGAVMVYVEARGEVRAPPDQGGGQVSATLVAGCYCIRTADGTHKDRKLDQAVKAECRRLGDPEVDESMKQVVLSPVASPEFKIGACGTTNLTAPRSSVLSPGPALCLRTVRCDDAPTATDCFRCGQPCNELNDLRNVPMIFTVDQSGGATAPISQVVLTDTKGQARANITVDDCSRPIKVRGQIMGRTSPPVEFDVQCVDPVPGFACGEELALLADREPVSMTRLPGDGPGPDSVAILYWNGADTFLQVLNPFTGLDTGVIRTFPGQTARAVHGFYYEVGVPPARGRSPMLAVLNSEGNNVMTLHLYRWEAGQLIDVNTGGWRMAGPCQVTLAGCTNNLDCSPSASFQTDVSMVSADVDGDGLADLALGTSATAQLRIYRSSLAEVGELFSYTGCACGQFGTSPGAFELLNFGAENEPGPVPPSLDLIIGAAGGAFAKYAARTETGMTVLSCGQSSRFGDLVPVRDVTRGRFGCNPALSGGCSVYDDVVIVAARTLGGGSFDDPGTIRVVFGGAYDVARVPNLFSASGLSVALSARTFMGRPEPRDPRAVEIGDFNGDFNDDAAVLFGSSEEVHIWVGASNRGLGELTDGVVLERCDRSLVPGSKCTPLRQFALPDLDGDGRSDIAVVCDASGDARLRWFSPRR